MTRRLDTREERKVVTVLFADLVGFTARAERLDPEDVRRLLPPYHALVRAELERFGGTVEKFIGDAVMARLRRAGRARGRSGAGRPGGARDPRRARARGELEVRIGVNTGEALVALGARPEAGEAMAAGDVVNTAARLQAAAPVDGILVGETTYRATERAIEYRERRAGRREGQGGADPGLGGGRGTRAPRRRRRAARRAARRPASASSTSSPTRSTARARERSPQLVTLVGVPGIGKSRLVAELFARRAASRTLISWRQGRSPAVRRGRHASGRSARW